MENLESKLNAIKTLVNTMESLPDSERAEVLDFALKQLNFKPGLSGTGTALLSNIVSEQVAIRPNVTMSIESFVESKKPINDFQHVAVLAYYLREQRDLRDFKTRDIAKACGEAGYQKISNVSGAINKARSRYGYFTGGTKSGTNQLSAVGRKLVEALPNHEKVQDVLKEFKKPNTKRKSKKISK